MPAKRRHRITAINSSEEWNVIEAALNKQINHNLNKLSAFQAGCSATAQEVFTLQWKNRVMMEFITKLPKGKPSVT